jgi:endonuclease/exonuclease/phosphatase family metal-dependent hydrolase
VKRAALFLALVGCGGGEVSADAVPVRVLTYNIGHPNPDEPNYALRLKDQDIEDYLGAQIRALDADIVVHQEVLSPTHCDTFTEDDPAFTCFDNDNRPPPIRRILGDDYSIVCDQRRHVECIGVHVDFGVIDGMDPGGFLLDGATTPELPLAECDWAAGTCNDTNCDGEATVSAVDVTVLAGALPIRLVHVHPNAAGVDADGNVYTGAPCRALQLEQAFENLVSADPTIMAGDFNMDPVRLASDDEDALWQAHVGTGNRFTDFTPVDEEGIQHATRRAGLGLAIDHVLADRATGSCTVWGDDFIASDPGTLPLDEGFDWSTKPDGQFYVNRMDHFAISCDLTLDLSVD